MDIKRGIIAIVTKDAKILMGKKKHKPGHFLSDKWHFPGGKAEENESYEDALLREMQEELNIKLRVISKIIEYSYISGEKEIFNCVFHCTTEEDPLAGDDLVEVGFFDYDEILNTHDRETYERLPSEVKDFLLSFFERDNQ